MADDVRDTCMGCEGKDDIGKCLSIECNIHNSWYARYWRDQYKYAYNRACMLEAGDYNG